jgi:hypothetical protein
MIQKHSDDSQDGHSREPEVTFGIPYNVQLHLRLERVCRQHGIEHPASDHCHRVLGEVIHGIDSRYHKDTRADILNKAVHRMQAKLWKRQVSPDAHITLGELGDLMAEDLHMEQLHYEIPLSDAAQAFVKAGMPEHDARHMQRLLERYAQIVEREHQSSHSHS